MLSLLGFTACGEAGLGSLGGDDSTNQGNGGVDDIPCMYGTPRVEFVVKGKVTDSAGVPIKGILVTAATSTDLKGVTDENGKFVTNKVSWPSMSGKIFFTDTDDHISTKWHEHGHAIQNCYYGPKQVVITVMSALRYHKFNKLKKEGKSLPEGYDDIWYEAEATALGRKYSKIIK